MVKPSIDLERGDSTYASAQTPGSPWSTSAASKPLLAVDDLRFGPAAAVSCAPLSFELQPGRALLVLGPNGVGKTSLLRTLLGVLPVQAGRIFWQGRALSSLSPSSLARSVALVGQSVAEPPDYSVAHYVLLGRLARLGAYAAPGKADRDRVMAVLDRLGIACLSDRPLDRLSGGEQQLARLARALAQDAPALLLDEPAAHLDPGNQARLLELLAQLRADGLALMMTTHEPWHVLGLADHVLIGTPRREWRYGPAAELMHPEILRAAYGLEFETATTAAGVAFPVPKRTRGAGVQAPLDAS